MPDYHSLAIHDLDSFIYGASPRPVRLANGLVIGGGSVLAALLINEFGRKAAQAHAPITSAK